MCLSMEERSNKGVNGRNIALLETLETWLHPKKSAYIFVSKTQLSSSCYLFCTSLKHRYQEQCQQKEKSEAKGGDQEEQVRGYSTYSHNAYTRNNRTDPLAR